MAKKSIKALILTARTDQTSLEGTGDLILRGFVGLTLALAHGIGKLPPPERFVHGVTELGFPTPLFFSWLAAGSEFAGGLLLAMGLATRPAAAAIAFTMAVAGFGQHAADPFRVKELAFLFLAIALHYMLAGAGQYSVDALLARRRRR